MVRRAEFEDGGWHIPVEVVPSRPEEPEAEPLDECPAEPVAASPPGVGTEELERALALAQRQNGVLADDVERLRAQFDERLATRLMAERMALLRDWLVVADTIQRALDSARTTTDEESPWYEGLKALRAQVLDLLARHGVEEMECEGRPFDPVWHEAVSTVYRQDGQDGTIHLVVQAGYILDGALLRPARVVTTRSEPTESPRRT